MYTAKYFEDMGIRSNLIGLVSEGEKDINKYSVGFEQVGWHYSRDFPNNFPPNRQIANAASLSIAVMKQYNIGIWDIVGHHEIQEKADPGDEFMATLRFVIAINEFNKQNEKGISSYNNGKSVATFIDIYEYLLQRVGKNRARDWDRYMGFSDFVSVFKNINSKYYS